MGEDDTLFTKPLAGKGLKQGLMLMRRTGKEAAH